MITLPYGRTSIIFELTYKNVKNFMPKIIDDVEGKQHEIVRFALMNPIKDKTIKINGQMKIGIGINDQSRPIPHSILIPELLRFLIENGAKRENITFYIATGTHSPVDQSLFDHIVNREITNNCNIVSHDCDNEDNLRYIGITTRNTPVYVNKSYLASDIKIVIGNIESHHFMGFSGGYKTASIGLTSRDTITANHSLLSHPGAQMGLFISNPMRQEVEEIGKMIGVDFAFNVVINYRKNILNCYWGDPGDVIHEGIDYIRDNIQLNLKDAINQFDLVIASPGGYPKDINFYQAQKALTHACLFAKPGGKIILAAECIDGFGSNKFERYMSNHATIEDVMSDFTAHPFEIGPHKAYQLSKQITRHEITLVSSMPEDSVKRLKIGFAENIQSAVDESINDLRREAKIAILPYATTTMPKITE